MTRTKQQDFEQAQVLHLIRDERDLELEDRARGRAHTGLQMGCLLLAALCYLQGDPAWTVLLALPLLGWSIHCFCRYAGDREPSFWRAAFSPASPPCFWEPHFWAVSWGRAPSPGAWAGRLCPAGRCAGRSVPPAVRAGGAGRLLAEGQAPQDGRGWMGGLFPVRLHPAAAARSGRNPPAVPAPHRLGRRPLFSALGFPFLSGWPWYTWPLAC